MTGFKSRRSRLIDFSVFIPLICIQHLEGRYHIEADPLLDDWCRKDAKEK